MPQDETDGSEVNVNYKHLLQQMSAIERLTACTDERSATRKCRFLNCGEHAGQREVMGMNIQIDNYIYIMQHLSSN
jgi:hypothetical protein